MRNYKKVLPYLSTLTVSSDNKQDKDESSRKPLRILFSFSLATFISCSNLKKTFYTTTILFSKNLNKTVY